MIFIINREHKELFIHLPRLIYGSYFMAINLWNGLIKPGSVIYVWLIYRDGGALYNRLFIFLIWLYEYYFVLVINN